MTSRRYGLFDLANKGASLTVENGGVLLLTTASGLSIARSCRSTVSVDADDSDVEFILFAAPGATPSISNKVSIGLCTAAASMSAYIGADGESIGYRPAEGQIHTGGASVEAVATAGLGAAIKVHIAFEGSGGGGTVAWYVDSALLTTRDLPAGMESSDLYFAVSLGSDAAAGDIRVQVNSGAWQMEYPTAGLTGWWESPELNEAVRVSTFPYLSQTTDDPPSARWEEGITSRGFVERRGINVWWWGNERQVQGSVLALQLTDPDGRFDFLLSNQYRDQPVRLQSADTADALGDATELGTYYFDRCEVEDDQTKTVYLRDVISLLALRLQPRRFRPDVDPQTANRVHATLIGVAGSIPTQLVDAGEGSGAEPIFQISGQDVEAIGKVREAGVPLDSALDYTLLAGGQQLQLATTPQNGEITLDASRTGAAYIPPSPVDPMAGDGDPFGGDPGTGLFDDFDAFEDNGALIVDHMPYYDPSDLGRAFFPQEKEALSHIEHKTATLTLGTRYRFSYTVHQLQPAIGTSVSPTQVGLTYGDGQFQRYSNCLSVEGPFPKTITGTFVCEATHAPNMYYAGNDVVGGLPAIVSDWYYTELPPLSDAGDDEEVEDALPTLGLEDAMRMILEDMAGLPSTVWESALAALIDSETGFAGGGVYFEDQATRAEALERLMPGYTAGIYKTREGTIGVLRMPLPEEVIDTDPIIIEAADLLSPLIPRPDLGLGLTRLVGVRRNERVLNDSDLDKPGLTLTQRARLARRHRYVLATGANFAPGYDHVDAAEPLDTALWFPADGQATADYAGQAYALPRAFYTTRLPYRDDIDLGTVLLLKYDRYGMEEGIAVVVVGLVEDRVNDVFQEIEFWGLAPYAD